MPIQTSDVTARGFIGASGGGESGNTGYMIALHNTTPEVQVQEPEYVRLLGYPVGHPLEGRPRELADWAREWYAQHGKPWVYAQTVPLQTNSAGVCISGVEFHSQRLQETLTEAGADQAALVLVSAGKECEEKARELWQEGKPDEYFFMEMYGSAVVEHLITSTVARVCAWAEQNKRVALPHYSPGYSGWDVAEQPRLFELLCRHSLDGLARRIRVLESGMLQPKKSLLAVVGITPHIARVRSSSRLVPCESCSFSPCAYRRAPYRFSLPQLEDVRRFQTGAPVEKNSTSELLDSAASYRINPRALRKWATERLELALLPDGGWEARFRYDGTTCSNLGQPLEFEYHVELASKADRYKIRQAECFPLKGDLGHKRMCEYISNGPELMKKIETEKPLLGQPLNDVLHWERPYSPAGCYCDLQSRNHKWGLVFEVIHFALAQKLKAESPVSSFSATQRSQSAPDLV